MRGILAGLSKLSSTRGIHEYQFTCEQQQIHEHKHPNTQHKQIQKSKYTNTHVKHNEIPTHEKQAHLEAVKNTNATKNVTRP